MEAFIRSRVRRYYWQDDLNCAATTLKVLAERFHVPIGEQVLQAAVGLHGAGGLGAQCGLVEGALMFLGIVAKGNGASDAEAASWCRGFAEAFERRFGSLRCAVLRPEGFKETNPPHLCEGLTRDALDFSIRYVSGLAGSAPSAAGSWPDSRAGAMPAYVHGYDARESVRLRDQAATLEALLHNDTAFPAGSRVLEAGCGVGAQTLPLARNSPGARITAMDISPASIAEARARLKAQGLDGVHLVQGDIFHAPFRPSGFDHVFVCFVLEHLPRPLEALAALNSLIRPEGTLTVVEGDHGSVCFSPASAAADRAIQCQVALQKRSGGNALIGRELYPMLRRAGFDAVEVSPRMVYADSSRPSLAEGFTRKTFTAMIDGVRSAALASGMIQAADFDQGIQDLRKAAEPEGVFCYTFFKATARKTR